jgi:hypothetical protein
LGDGEIGRLGDGRWEFGRWKLGEVYIIKKSNKGMVLF